MFLVTESLTSLATDHLASTLLPLPTRYCFHGHLSVCLLAKLYKYDLLEHDDKTSEAGSWSNLDLIRF